MEEKISLNLFFAGLIASMLAIVLTVFACYGTFEKQINNDLDEMSTLISAVYGQDTGEKAFEMFAGHNLRITHVANDGKVLYDSDAAAISMDNHLNRPEISKAISDGSSYEKRMSDTLGQTIYYHAIRLNDGTVLRVAMRADGISDTFKGMFPIIIIIFILTIVLAVLFSVTLTKKLVRPIKLLTASVGSDEDFDRITANERIYPELEPFIKKIWGQQDELSIRLHEISDDKRKLEAIITNMSEGLLILDDNHHVVLINNSAKNFFSLKSDEHVGENIMYLSRDTDFNEIVGKAYAGERAELIMTKFNRDYNVTANAVKGADGESGVICLICDVTEKNRANELRIEFTANVSHELKTPLTSISGYAEMIENGMAKSEDVVVFAEKIHREAQRMLMLISDIIKLSELDSESGTRTGERVDLMNSVRSVVDILEHSAEQQKVTINIGGCDGTVDGDCTLTSEILYNLIDNAIRYNKPGGRVDITVSSDSVIIADTGIGIPPESVPRVFERFYRVDKSRSKQTGGTGLGLAIVRHAAQLQGAVVELSSVSGEGTNIKVSWNK